MNLATNDYKIIYEKESSTIFFQGLLRLSGIEDYKPVLDLLLDAIAETSNLTINLKNLEFLNSSGISMLSMFVIKARQKGNVNLVFQGSEEILWQTKSLKNLQRLMPSLKLEFT